VRPGAVVLALLLPLACPPGARAAGELRLPPVERVTFENGLRVMVARSDELPLVEISLLVGAGAAQDPAGQEGLASLTADALGRGAGDLDPARAGGRARARARTRAAPHPLARPLVGPSGPRRVFGGPRFGRPWFGSPWFGSPWFGGSWLGGP
jgi:hypothetical protein